MDTMYQDLPPELLAEQQAIERNRKMAEKLQAQAGNMPQGQMVSGIYVKPAITQYMAQALKGYQSKQMGEEADKRAAGVSEGYSKRMSEALSKAGGAMAGRPEEVLPEGVFGPAAPAVAPDPKAAQRALIESGIPSLQKQAIAAQLKGMEPQKPLVVGRTLMDATGKQLGVDSTWQAEQQAAREARRQELEMRLADLRTSREEQAALRRELAGMSIQARKDMASAVGAMGREKAPAGYRFNPDGSLAPIKGGPADPKMKTGPDGMPKLTESQGKANLYQSRATESDKIINELEGQYSPLAINAKQGVGKMWGIGGALETAANVALPKNSQKAEQAQRDFVNAILRQESGAVINPDEFANAQKQYFPQPGDAKEVIAQKKKNRETAINGLRVMSGPAATMAPQQPAGGGSNVDDLLKKYGG